MQHKENHFDGYKGVKIYYQSWVPENIKGVIMIVHGFGEHSGRYMNVVNTLVPEGYAVYALDHRGHGKSEGKMNHVERFTDFFEDLSSFEEIIRENHPDLPFHVIGHSMGSIIANNYVSSRDMTKYKSLTLSGTGAAPGPAINGITIVLSKIFSVLLPKISIASGLSPDFISHDEAVIEAYKNDPYVRYKKITPRLGNEMMNYVNQMNDAAGKLTLPTMMQIGSEDDAFHPDSWDGLYESIAVEDKVFHKYDGYRHEVYNEVKKEVPLEDLKNWINSHN